MRCMLIVACVPTLLSISVPVYHPNESVDRRGTGFHETSSLRGGRERPCLCMGRKEGDSACAFHD